MTDDINDILAVLEDPSFRGRKGDKGDKGDKGELGDKGDKGEPGEIGKTGALGTRGVKGDKGERGAEGKLGKSIAGLIGSDGLKGDKGEPGQGIIDAKIIRNGDLIITFEDGREENVGHVRGRDGRSGQTGGGTYNHSNMQNLDADDHKQYHTDERAKIWLDTLGVAKGDIFVFDKDGSWEVLPIGTFQQHLVPNPTEHLGVAWQQRGLSYLTNENGDLLTNEASRALEGKDDIDALLLNNRGIIEINEDYTVTINDGMIDVDTTNGNVNITLYTIVGNLTRELKVRKSDSSSNTITLTAEGSEKINGAATLLISSQFTTETIIVLSTEWARI